MASICFFHKFMKIGGVERQLYYLLNGLSEHHDVSLVLCSREGEFLEQIDRRVRIYSLETRPDSFRGPMQIYKFVRCIGAIHPEVLVSFHPDLHLASCLAKCVYPLKVVCCFPGYMPVGYLNAFRCAYLRLAAGLVAVSESVRHSILSNIGPLNRTLHVIENAIDAREIVERSADASSVALVTSVPLIVSVGRLVPGKRFETLVAALGMMRHNAHLVLVGGGPQRAKLAEYINAAGLASRVLLTGEQRNPYPIVKQATVFALASETEGLPTVVLEAMALRRPVVCAKYAGGTAGVVEDGVNGIVTPLNNPLAMAQALDKLLDYPELAEQLAEQAHRRIMNTFTVQSYVDKYDALLVLLSRQDR